MKLKNFPAPRTRPISTLLAAATLPGLLLWLVDQNAADLVAALRYGAAIVFFGLARLTAICQVCSRRDARPASGP
jgi:hypothetical protein